MLTLGEAGLSIYRNSLYWFTILAAATAKSLQSCPTLCDPIDGSPPGSPVPGILQARTLEWVAISFYAINITHSSFWKIQISVQTELCGLEQGTGPL